MNQNRSVATVDAPEFINLKPNALNPGISECEIKVFYLGENRNHSYIDKNTAIQMANSLPGCPIVGAYIERKEDFGDHGHVMTIEDGEVHFSCKTVPYGFVDPNAQVWFQKFVDTDDFGNDIEREYLMTTGFLWTHTADGAQTLRQARQTEAVKKVLRCIRSDYAEPLTLEMLATHANLDPKYLCRMFRRVTGRTPIDYLNYYRIECAAELLCLGNESVTDIALQCGFGDVSYFSRVFRRLKNETPSEYRRAHKQ